MKDRSDDPSHHEQTLLPRSYISLHKHLNSNKLLTDNNFIVLANLLYLYGKDGIFYLSVHLTPFMLICIQHIVKDYSESERGNPLPPLHGLLFLISSKGSFICIIPQTWQYILQPLLHQLWSRIWLNAGTMRDWSDDLPCLNWMLYH